MVQGLYMPIIYLRASWTHKLFNNFVFLDSVVSPKDPMDHEDYFGVQSMIDLKEMFDARVHLGHHEGAWDPLTRPYIHGLRSTQHIIDLEKSMECLEVLD